MPNITNITAPRVPFLDANTGLISREWYRFLLNLFTLAGGGSNGTTLLDLQKGPINNVNENVTVINNDLQGLALTPLPQVNNFVDTNYVDFQQATPFTRQTARMGWNSSDQTLDLGMDYGVVQQIGLETYARVENATGVTIPNGTVVGFAGVGANNTLSVSPYNADGSVPTLYILGVMTHDLPNSGEVGYCTTWGHVRDVDTSAFSVGDILYADPATPGAFTNVKPTAPDAVIPLAAVLQVDATNGEIFVRPTIEQQSYYGQFLKTTNQTPAAINTAYAITFDSAPVANGISIGTPTSRIVVAESGLYNFAPTFQISSGSSSSKNVWLWFRINGTDVANSAILVTSDINNGYVPVARSDFFSLDAGDYIELMWAADSTNVALDAVASTAFAPGSPAVILAVTQVQQ